jgi:putative ABC transport system substrate-binding protein
MEVVDGRGSAVEKGTSYPLTDPCQFGILEHGLGWLVDRMQFDQWKRREFITLIGGAAAAWPIAALAQQPALPVIGFISSGSPATNRESLPAFRQGLRDAGFVEGRNVVIEYRWGDEIYDRLPALAADLVRRGVNVIAAVGGGRSVLAAKAATSTIPIVFSGGSDPVAAGLVASLNRPGGNLTGASFFSTELGPKRLELLHQLIPAATRIAVLLNPTNRNLEALSKILQAAAGGLGLQLDVVHASADRDIDMLFPTLARLRAGALLVGPDNYIFSRNGQIAALALRHALPTMYQWREFADAGGLMTYGASQYDVYHQVGVYAGRILKGDKPADLPIVQSTKIELVINLRTAKALGLDVPAALLASADAVIE